MLPGSFGGRRCHSLAIDGTRAILRTSLVHNTEVLPIQVDAGDGTVTLDGRVLAADPVSEVPLSRRYLLG
jgi:urease alpha subunit